MKQQLLNQIKIEGNMLAFAEHIRPKVEYWLNFKSLSPSMILSCYFDYLQKHNKQIKYFKKINGELKIKVIQEPLGSKNPFSITLIPKMRMRTNK